ncbi:MAG TPA: twin-arginine translocation signal domain-containing protein [Candidatus Sulfotelmatobacter sp.]|nr:twin-arginine translocation signal domain-containing protein [Candidatus Sulfotelmatobacter sp.]
MLRLDVNRREFLKIAGGAGAAMALPTSAETAAASRKTIGIQIGAVSFVDEGTERVLDILQERGGVNTLFLAVFTYGRGIAGRQIPGQPLPDHGKQEYDLNFHGGNFATPHPEFYKNTVLKDTRAPDHGNLDILAEVLPAAKKRGMKTICWLEDVFRKDLPNIEKLQEKDLYGRNAETLCVNNPDYRNFLTGLVEDYTRSYDVDGIMWGSERQGALCDSLGATHDTPPVDPGNVTCFCEFCQRKAKDRGINVDRARQGFLELEKFVRSSRAGKRPVDGYFVQFWRLALRYPELLAWEMLWTDSLRETYAAIYKTVKAAKQALPVGWHIWHNNSFNPIYRAEQDLHELSKCSDFIKVVMYNNCGGERMALYVDNIGSTLYADLSKQQLLDFDYAVMNFKEGSYQQIPHTGLSPDYVYRETKRALDGVAGTSTLIWPGIDIDIPTEPDHSKCTRQSVKEAVAAAFRAGAPGVILSRKYSEMRLGDLSGAGDAIRELKLGV